MASDPRLLAVVVRGSLVESRHYGHVAVADVKGRVRFSVGEADRGILPRSSLKPIQALAGVLNGTDQQFSFSQAELSVTCASHRAQPEHRAAVQRILKKVGAREQDLHCGPHEPSLPSVRNKLIRSGRKATPIYNNCSGKHAGMLALAKVLGAPFQGYWELNHPVQKEVRRVLREHCDIEARAELFSAVDGCAIPNYMLTLRQLAMSFARLASPAPGPLADACRRLTAAIMANPEMIGGRESRDTLLMQHLPGLLISKSGAEGVQAIGLPHVGLGIAIKIEDGSDRALWPICLSLLKHLDLLEQPFPSGLEKMWRPAVQNTRGETVGYIQQSIFEQA